MELRKLTLVLIVFLVGFTKTSFAGNTAATKPFNASEMIMHHITDAHEWHLWGETALYLPVILKTDNGLEMFNSSDLYHNPTSILVGEKEETVYTSSDGRFSMFHETIYNTEEGLVFDEEGHPLNSNPLDFSITKNVLAMLVAVLVIMFLFFKTARNYKTTQVPRGLAGFMEPLVLYVRDEIAIPNIGKEKYMKFMPYLLTVFFFIWANNLLGLIPIIPGGANVTGNIAVTAVLAIITFIIVNVNGNKNYWGHIFAMPGVPIWVLVILTPVEIIGLFSKPFALAVRLFANITAGHIVVLGLVSIIFIFQSYAAAPVSILMVLFISCLELLVAFLQAYVFTLLTALFIGMAVEEAHH